MRLGQRGDDGIGHGLDVEIGRVDAKGRLGVLATVVTAGEVNVGDAVEVLAG
jgi:MOSC domain-containing protein YiiM